MSMTIQNFDVSNGPIREASCENVPNLMIIAGPNGVGKSTLLETLFANLARGRSGGDVAEASSESQPVYFSPHRAPTTGSIQEQFLYEISEESYREALSQRGGYNVNARSAPNSIRSGNWSRSRSQPDAAPYFEVKKRLTQLYSKRTDMLTDTYEELGRVPEDHIPDITGPLREAVRSVLPGIEFIGIAKEEQNQEYRVLFENRNGVEVEFDQLSSGEKDVIALLMLLVEEKIEKTIAEVRGEDINFDDLIILIDGPESYLHPQLQLNFLEFVREQIEESDINREIQVLICTHSQMILENAMSKELYLLVYPDQREGNQLVNIDDIDMDLFRTLTGELGTAALSTGNPLLLVEGKTDRELIRLMYPDIEDEITIVPMGGKSGIVALDDAFDKLLPELVPAGIEPFALVDMDRDVNSNRDISDRIFILPATCMENLLLDAEGLYESINVLAGDQVEERGINSPENVSELISEIVASNALFRHEMVLRINERLVINANVRNISNLETTEIIEELDEVVATKKERLQDDIPEIRASIRDAVEKEKLDELDGKYILGELGSRFNIKREKLARSTADKLREIDNQPDVLDEIIEEITQSV